MRSKSVFRIIGTLIATALLAPAAYAGASSGDELADENLPPHLRDRGTGLPTSQFGIYVRRGELLVYPSFEYYKDKDFEYDPFEFGFESATEFKGRYRKSEEVLFLAYGLSDRFALEFEGALTQASLKKAAEDLSGMPAERKESGLGDVQTRLTWRWLEERGRRPELFIYSEVFFPHDKKKPLVGTADWVLHNGFGLTRGFRWATVTFRAGFLFEEASASATDWGEVQIEVLKRLSPRVTLFGALVVLEGDEIFLVNELRWNLSPHVSLRLNNGQGLTSHGNDWEPEIGILFSLPR